MNPMIADRMNELAKLIDSSTEERDALDKEIMVARGKFDMLKWASEIYERENRK